MKNLSQYSKGLILRIFIALIFVGGLAYLIKISLNQYFANKKLTEEITQLTDRTNQIIAIKQDLEKDNSLIQKTIDYFPLEGQSKLVKELEILSRGTDTQITEIKFLPQDQLATAAPTNTTSEEGAGENQPSQTQTPAPSSSNNYPYTISIKGGLSGIYNFLKGMDNMPMFTSNQSINLTQENNEENQEIDNFTLTLDGYYIKESGEKQPPNKNWPNVLQLDLTTDILKQIAKSVWPSEKVNSSELSPNPFMKK